MPLYKKLLAQGSSFLGVLLLAAFVCGQELPTRDGVVAALKRQEALVRSFRCRIRSTNAPTNPDAVPLIRSICRFNGNESDYLSFVIDDGFVHSNNYTARWWRKGDKERSETVFGDRKSTVAYDGNIIRSISKAADGESIGALDTRTSGHWNAVEPQPFSFLFEFVHQSPYSAIVADSTECKIERAVAGGVLVSRITVRPPKHPSFTFRLDYDASLRLVQRQLWMKSKGIEYLREVHEFSEYRDFKDARGQTITFPTKAVYHYYVGPDPAASSAEYTQRTFSLTDIEFNLDLPDDLFALQFPPGIPIHDGLNKLPPPAPE